MTNSRCCPLTQFLLSRLISVVICTQVHSAPAVFKISQQEGFCLFCPVKPHELDSLLCINSLRRLSPCFGRLFCLNTQVAYIHSTITCRQQVLLDVVHLYWRCEAPCVTDFHGDSISSPDEIRQISSWSNDPLNSSIRPPLMTWLLWVQINKHSQVELSSTSLLTLF